MENRPRINYKRADGTDALKGDIYCDTSQGFAIGDMLTNRDKEPLAMLVNYGDGGRTSHLLTPDFASFTSATIGYLRNIREAFLNGEIG